MELLKNNHQFISETDTEVIAHLIEDKFRSLSFRAKSRNLKKRSLHSFHSVGMTKAVFSTFKELRGSNAIAVLDLKPKQSLPAEMVLRWLLV